MTNSVPLLFPTLFEQIIYLPSLILEVLGSPVGVSVLGPFTRPSERLSDFCGIYTGAAESGVESMPKRVWYQVSADTVDPG